MVNEIDFSVDVEGLGYIDIEVLEIFITNVGDVFKRSRLEIVNAQNAISLRQKRFAEVRTEETRASCDQAS